jgi:sucrose phosphorylase
MQPQLSSVRSDLKAIYGEPAGNGAFERLRIMLDHHILPAGNTAEKGSGLSERDALLITYADQLSEPGTPPLVALGGFCERHLRGVVTGIHLLPFFPSSSDDGFAVADFRSVDPRMGSWDDVERLARSFDMMIDVVINHVSARHAWFQSFLRDDPGYRDYFVVIEGRPDLSEVVRPRSLSLLTRFDTPSGQRHVWTTFSEDQVDLNFRNPDVLLEIIDLILYYAARGARFIRLDAVAYLWKEIGTPCINLPQTHGIIRILRHILDMAAPHVLLISETNVPHAENISYFGNGGDEAQVVYNFALPPLVLHTIQTGDSRALTAWAAELRLPSERATFLNFLASHDGIGVSPVRDILSQAELDALIARAVRHAGLVSYRTGPGGAPQPYELNINYFDALSNPSAGEAIGTGIARFMAAQAIMLALMGVPGIYFHSLFGSRGWPAGVNVTGRNRTINRQKFDLNSIEAELADPSSLRHQVFDGYVRLLQARAASPAFHPNGRQQVLNCGESIFAILRYSPDGAQSVLCLHNVSNRPQIAVVRSGDALKFASGRLLDLITKRRADDSPDGRFDLGPYEALWLAVPE